MPQAIRNALDLVLDSVQCYKEYEGTQFGIDQYDLIQKGILKYALYVIFFAMLMGIFMYFMRQTVVVMSRLIEYDLRKELYAKYQELDYSFFKKNKTGDLLVSLFSLVIYAMYRVNPTLTFYTLLPLPFLSLSIFWVSNKIKQKSELIQIQLSRLTSIAQEVYSGIRIIKSYVSESRFGRMFKVENEIYQEKSLDLARVNALFFPLMILLISTSTLLTVLVGGWQVYKGQATPGNIAEFVIYVNMLTWPVTAIGWIASIVQQAEASQKRINEFLFTESLIKDSANAIEIDRYDIEFDQVSFTYENTGIKALDKVSFKLNEGEKVVILGRTASGKTSIAELLLRMYEVTSGEIKVGGQAIQNIKLKPLREAMAYVPQDLFLFSDTVSNNIKFGNDQLNQAEIEEYAQYASVHEDILSLPEQYDTMVGERGVTLSGGQKQRVAIARALIKNPQIVILDDCLSAVDTDTEQRILNLLNVKLKDKTAILITHRIYNLMDFDNIIVLDEGRIVEQGTHDKLMEKAGHYFNMYTQQNANKQAV